MSLSSIFVCGGDERSVFAAEYFRQKAYDVKVFGHGDDSICPDDVRMADAVFLGLPAEKNGYINMPLSQHKLSLDNLLENCREGTLVCGGRFSDENYKTALKYNVKLLDYSADEIFQRENALYTAEGVLSKIIDNTTRSAMHIRILVIGYGRIGRAITELTCSKIWSVSVWARKEEVRAECDVKGIKTISSLKNLSDFDVIVNTVPCNLLTREYLAGAKKGVLVVDVSESPGYVDKSICRDMDIELMYLPGIPRLSAPESAGISAAGVVERFTEGIE